MATICFYAEFIGSKVGVNGLTVTWDIERITRSTGARSALVTGGATSITIGRRGLYGYVLAGADLTLYDYVATAITAAATVDQQEVAAVWTLWSISGEQAVWNEPLTAATHNVPTSSGRRLRQLSDVVIIDGIIGAGSTANTLVLNGGASAVDGAYDPALVYISSGTGVGQCRNILEYEGATRRCWVDRDWKVTPAAGDEYVILADAGREHVNEGHAQSGGANWIQLNTLASANNDAYNGQVVFIRSGTGQDQARRITDYVGASRTAYVYPNWETIPDATSTGAILPTAVMTNEQIGGAVWNTLTATLTTVGSIGKYIVDYLATIVAKTNLLGGATVAVVSPVATSGDVTIIRGDSYLNVDGRRIEWSSTSWSIAAASTLLVIIQDVDALTATRLSATSIGIELTTTQTAALPDGDFQFSVQEVKVGGERITRVQGLWNTMTRPIPIV